MKVNFEVLESQLSETEMALLIGVNLALNAARLAGANAILNLAHMKQHEENFRTSGKNRAAHIMAALQEMHRSAAGMRET